MSFEPEFLDFMKDTLIKNVRTGYTAYGAPTYSTGTTSYRCRIVKIHETFTMDNGAESLLENLVYLASTDTFDPEDRFTFPDGSTPILEVIAAYPDEDGPYHHLQLKFGNRAGRV
jgi:hypothetical protein